VSASKLFDVLQANKPGLFSRLLKESAGTGWVGVGAAVGVAVPWQGWPAVSLSLSCCWTQRVRTRCCIRCKAVGLSCNWLACKPLYREVTQGHGMVP